MHRVDRARSASMSGIVRDTPHSRTECRPDYTRRPLGRTTLAPSFATGPSEIELSILLP